MQDKRTREIMQTETENTRIAVINTNIGFIQKDILEIKSLLKDTYATRDALIQVAKDTEARFIRLENQSNLTKWLAPIISALFATFVTFLMIQYLTSVR